MICKDILKQIFIHLSGRDLLSCSVVCKIWYSVSQDNQLWFNVLRRELPKKIKRNRLLKIDPRFTYSEDVIYKSLYQSSFNHHYQPGTIKELYSTSCSNFGFCFTIICLPMIFPVILVIEMYDLYVSKQKRNEYCNCETCDRRSKMILEKYYK
jgi:hypothetical protein